jgi:hypothetical protein
MRGKLLRWNLFGAYIPPKQLASHWTPDFKIPYVVSASKDA